jgi:prefoldin beta subunit
MRLTIQAAQLGPSACLKPGPLRRHAAPQELELLEDENKVYKLIGPALVRQDIPEATSNVSKRLEFIGGELKRLDDKLAALEDRANKRQQQLEQQQRHLLSLQQAAAGGAG